MPRVTILLPVFNGARYIRAAIDSVLAQTYRDYELLVIDDGSGDDSADIALSYADPRLRVERNGSNLGLVETLNRGLDLASGDFVARLDADDVCLPERLAVQTPTPMRMWKSAYAVPGTCCSVQGSPGPSAYPPARTTSKHGYSRIARSLIQPSCSGGRCLTACTCAMIGRMLTRRTTTSGCARQLLPGSQTSLGPSLDTACTLGR